MVAALNWDPAIIRQVAATWSGGEVCCDWQHVFRCTRVKCRQVCIIHCLKKLGSLRELNKASRTKITNERCEFVKLCRINCRGWSGFVETQYSARSLQQQSYWLNTWRFFWMLYENDVAVYPACWFQGSPPVPLCGLRKRSPEMNKT